MRNMIERLDERGDGIGHRMSRMRQGSVGRRDVRTHGMMMEERVRMGGWWLRDGKRVRRRVRGNDAGSSQRRRDLRDGQMRVQVARGSVGCEMGR